MPFTLPVFTHLVVARAQHRKAELEQHALRAQASARAASRPPETKPEAAPNSPNRGAKMDPLATARRNTIGLSGVRGQVHEESEGPLVDENRLDVFDEEEGRCLGPLHKKGGSKGLSTFGGKNWNVRVFWIRLELERDENYVLTRLGRAERPTNRGGRPRRASSVATRSRRRRGWDSDVPWRFRVAATPRWDADSPWRRVADAAAATRTFRGNGLTATPRLGRGSSVETPRPRRGRPSRRRPRLAREPRRASGTTKAGRTSNGWARPARSRTPRAVWNSRAAR